MLQQDLKGRVPALEQGFLQAMAQYAAFLSSQELAAFIKGAQLTADLDSCKAQQVAAFKAGVQFAANQEASLDMAGTLAPKGEATKLQIAVKKNAAMDKKSSLAPKAEAAKASSSTAAVTGLQ